MALKRSSEIITISGAYFNNTGGFTTEAFDLQLNPLDQEVFVVLAVALDFTEGLPLVAGGLVPQVRFVETPIAFTTTRPAVQNTLANSSCFAFAQQRAVIAHDGSTPPVLTSYAVATETPNEVPDANLDYIAIIATSDFFVGGTDDPLNTSATQASFKIYGYRAKADAATYAALVQSEVLSS